MKKILLFIMLICLTGCARMGQPDGGWFDETPPRVVSSSPGDGSTNVSDRKVIINFDEFIKLDNPNEKVIISPPQIEQAEIKSQGKRIVVALKDSLKPNTTYTIDFSDAISDNNEGNPMGNYTYRFSTGESIDSMEVSGYVVEANNMEPVKGILVGLYDSNSDKDLFKSEPFMRVSRTDGRGRFVIKGVASGSYRIYALYDTDGDFHLTQRGEKIAFTDQIVVPSFKPDIRQDTIWADSLHIASIKQTGYTHFLPDDIVLRAFSEEPDERYLMKTQRTEPELITMAFSCGHEELPRLRPLNFRLDDNSMIVETSLKKDTVLYWLRDTALINQDTLRLETQYWATDTTGVLQITTDTVELIPRFSHAKRMRDKEKRLEQWQKKQERAEKAGRKVEYVRPGEALEPKYTLPSELDPDGFITIKFPAPVEAIDTSRVHIYARHDSLWYKVAYRQIHPQLTTDQQTIEKRRSICLQAAWIPNTEYSFEADSAAFTDIYNRVSQKYKKGFRVRADEEYGSLFVNISGSNDSRIIVQLLNEQDKVVRESKAENGTAEFYYLLPDNYYMRAYADTNGNGEWDSGIYDQQQQPEMVYYYPKSITIRELWDLSENWNLTATPAYRQKPYDITKQRAEEKKNVRNLNAERARKLGKQLPDYLQR